jgi:hypothetical protein
MPWRAQMKADERLLSRAKRFYVGFLEQPSNYGVSGLTHAVTASVMLMLGSVIIFWPALVAWRQHGTVNCTYVDIGKYGPVLHQTSSDLAFMLLLFGMGLGLLVVTLSCWRSRND